MVETNEKVGKYNQYLLEGENIKKIYNLGMFTLDIFKVLITDKRFIVIKKFPKNIIELNFNNIELAEYYTNVEWLRLMFGIVFFILIGIYIASRDFILKGIAEFLPPLEVVLEAQTFLGMKVGNILILFVLLIGALYYTGLFVNSLFGRLRIIIYEQAPFDIITPMNGDIAEIIKIIESSSDSHSPNSPSSHS